MSSREILGTQIPFCIQQVTSTTAEAETLRATNKNLEGPTKCHL